jgi:hypothetical protein
MTIGWSAPLNNGGCPIVSYQLFMDDGLGGAIVEIDAASVNNIPSLRSHAITSFVGGDISNTFRFYMIVNNVVGSVTSSIVSYVLADKPNKPISAPTINLVSTTAY